MQNINDFGLYGAQVLYSRNEYGPNTLPQPRVQSFWEKYVENFEDPLIHILCFCVVIVMFLAYCGYASITESYGIIFSILISTFVGTLSEFRSEANFMELQKEASRVTVLVVRKGVGAWVDRGLNKASSEKLVISWKNPEEVEESIMTTSDVEQYPSSNLSYNSTAVSHSEKSIAGKSKVSGKSANARFSDAIYVNPYTAGGLLEEQEAQRRHSGSGRVGVGEGQSDGRPVGEQDEDDVEMAGMDGAGEEEAMSISQRLVAQHTRVTDLALDTFGGKLPRSSTPPDNVPIFSQRTDTMDASVSLSSYSRKAPSLGKVTNLEKSVCVPLRVEDLVVGDCVLLQPGDMVPADGYLLCGEVSVSQKSLTGEDVVLRKTPPPEFSDKSKKSGKVGETKNTDGLYGDISVHIPYNNYPKNSDMHSRDELELCYVPPSVPMSVNKSGHADNLDEATALYRGSLVEEGEGVMCVVSVGCHTVYARIVTAGEDDDDADEEGEEDGHEEGEAVEKAGAGGEEEEDADTYTHSGRSTRGASSKQQRSRIGDDYLYNALDDNEDDSSEDDDSFENVSSMTSQKKSDSLKPTFAVNSPSVADFTIENNEASRLCRTRDQPLRRKLSRLAHDITNATYKIATFMAVAFMVKQIVIDHDWEWKRIVTYLCNYHVLLHDLVTAVMYAVIVLVVSVPEGLPMMIALVLSLNMRKLLKAHVLVRRLIGIETAGSLNLLCVDKTGTLTEGSFSCAAVLWVGRRERWLGLHGPRVGQGGAQKATEAGEGGSEAGRSNAFGASTTPSLSLATPLSSSSPSPLALSLFHRYVGSCIRSACGRASITLPPTHTRTHSPTHVHDRSDNDQGGGGARAAVTVVGGNASDRAVLQFVYESVDATNFTNCPLTSSGTPMTKMSTNDYESTIMGTIPDSVHTDLFSPLPGQESHEQSEFGSSPHPQSSNFPNFSLFSGLYSANVRIVEEKPFTSASKRSLTQLRIDMRYLHPYWDRNKHNEDAVERSGHGVNSTSLAHALAVSVGGYVCDENGEKLAKDDFSNMNGDCNTEMTMHGIGVTVIKGAAEAVLDQCTHVLLPQTCQDMSTNYTKTSIPYQRIPLCGDYLSQLQAEMDNMAAQGARLIAVAVASHTIQEIEDFTHKSPDSEDAPTSPTNTMHTPSSTVSSSSPSFTLLCVLALADALRPSTAPALAALRRAGVQVVMITGDKCETALAIAAQAGMLGEDGEKSKGSSSCGGGGKNASPVPSLPPSCSFAPLSTPPSPSPFATSYLWPHVLQWARQHSHACNTHAQTHTSTLAPTQAQPLAQAQMLPRTHIRGGEVSALGNTSLPSPASSTSFPASSSPLLFSASSPLFLYNLLLCYLNTQRQIALTSSHLHLLSDIQLAQLLPRLVVVARALPSDKVRVLQVAQARHVLLAGEQCVRGLYGVGMMDAERSHEVDRERARTRERKDGKHAGYHSTYMSHEEDTSTATTSSPRPSSPPSSSSASTSAPVAYVSAKLVDTARYVRRFSLTFARVWRIVGAQAPNTPTAQLSPTSSSRSAGPAPLLSLLHTSLFWDPEHRHRIPMAYYTFQRVFGAEPPPALMQALCRQSCGGDSCGVPGGVSVDAAVSSRVNSSNTRAQHTYTTPTTSSSSSHTCSLSPCSTPSLSLVRGPTDTQDVLVPYVVGMLGDGVNDSAALKKADVSFAMGSAMEITKEAADVVLLDNNLGSVVSAAKYGRAIFTSIRKFIVFQCTVNAVALIICVLGPFLGFDMPLTLVQLLWVNLIMDTFAALAFGGEPALDEFLSVRPVHRFCDIVSPRMWASIKYNALYIATLAIIFLTYDPCVELFFNRVHESNEYVTAMHEAISTPMPMPSRDIVVEHDGRTTIHLTPGIAITIGGNTNGDGNGREDTTRGNDNRPGKQPEFEEDMTLSQELQYTSPDSKTTDQNGKTSVSAETGSGKSETSLTSGADLTPARYESNEGLAKQGGLVFLTAFFSFFVMSCTVHAFNVRTGDAVSIFAHLRENSLFIIIIPGILCIQVLFTCSYPFTRFLRTVPLTISEWMAVIIPAFSVLIFDAIRKKYFLHKIPEMDTVNYPDMYSALSQYNKHYRKQKMGKPTISKLMYIPGSENALFPSLQRELSYFCPALRSFFSTSSIASLPPFPSYSPPASLPSPSPLPALARFTPTTLPTTALATIPNTASHAILPSTVLPATPSAAPSVFLASVARPHATSASPNTATPLTGMVAGAGLSVGMGMSTCMGEGGTAAAFTSGLGIGSMSPPGLYSRSRATSTNTSSRGNSSGSGSGGSDGGDGGVVRGLGRGRASASVGNSPLFGPLFGSSVAATGAGSGVGVGEVFASVDVGVGMGAVAVAAYRSSMATSTCTSTYTGVKVDGVGGYSADSNGDILHEH